VNAKLLLTALLALLLPGSALAQQPAELPARELEYRAASSAFESARDAWSVAERAWNVAVEEHARARRAGDQDRQEVQLTRALDRVRELEMHERRVTDSRAALARARTALLAAIRDRMATIERQRVNARTTAEASQLAAVLRDLENQQDELEAEAEGSSLSTSLVYYEAIQYDPRDDAESLASKDEMLRSKSEKKDSTIAQVESENEPIGKHMSRARNAQAQVTWV
jgi:hypothetical protein